MFHLTRSLKAGKLLSLRTTVRPAHTMRHELKFIINEGTYRELKARLTPLLPPDAHSLDGGYRVTSVYFDDIYRSAYLDKINGVMERKKFRIRAYNLSPSRITLEAKHKEGEFVYKLSDPLDLDQYGALLRGDSSFMSACEDEDRAAGEYYRSDRLVRLKPRVIVDYYREALVNPAGNVRITFDKSLSTCYNTIDMFDKNAFYSKVFDKEIILEVKFDEFLPEYVQSVLQGLNAPMQSVSKYVLCCDKTMEVKGYDF